MERHPGPKVAGCSACGTRLASVFARMDNAALARLDRAHLPHSYSAGQVLFYEGTPCHAVFCVRSGVAKVYRATSRGRSYILFLARAGDVLGLESVLADGPYAATVEMLEDGIVCRLEREALTGALERDPTVWRDVAKVVASQLLRSEEERAELASSDLRERLAATLLGLAARWGDEENDGVVLHVNLSRDDLANLIGASTEATIRQLGELKRRGLVSTDGRTIRIDEPSRLARLARLTAQPRS